MTTLIMTKNQSLKFKVVHVLENTDCNITELSDINEYTPSSEDIVFVFPYTEIAQTRLKELSTRLKFKVTKDLNKATIGFQAVSKGIYTRYLYCTVPSKYVLKIDPTLKIEGPMVRILHNIRQWDWARHVQQHFGNTSYPGWNQKDYLVTSKKVEFCKDFKLYNDTTILRLLASDKDNLLTPTKFTNLSKLISSRDTETRKLGIEILKTVDYVNNALFVLVLFKEYPHEIPTTIKAIKSMLKYYALENNDIYHLNAGRIITVLKHINQYNEASLNQLGEIFKLVYQAESHFNIEESNIITDENEIEL